MHEYGELLATIHSKEAVGDRLLLTSFMGQTQRRSGTVIAQEYTTVAAIDKSTWHKIVKLQQKMPINGNFAQLNNTDNHYETNTSDFLSMPKRLITVLDKKPQLRLKSEIQYMLDYLYQYRFFQQLPKHAVIKLAQQASVRELNNNDIICRQGDIGTEFYLIMCGNISVHIKNNDDDVENEVIENNNLKIKINLESIESKYGSKVCELHSGDTFGERALLTAYNAHKNNYNNNNSSCSSTENSRSVSPIFNNNDNTNTNSNSNASITIQNNSDANMNVPNIPTSPQSKLSVTTNTTSTTSNTAFKNRHTPYVDKIHMQRQATLICSTDVRLLCITLDIYMTVLEHYHSQLEFHPENCISALRIMPDHRAPEHCNLLLQYFRHPPARIFFGQLPYGIREKVCQVVTLMEPSRGDVIFEQNDEPRMFYIILKGRVGAYQKVKKEHINEKNIKNKKISMANIPAPTVDIDMDQYHRLLDILKETKDNRNIQQQNTNENDNYDKILKSPKNRHRHRHRKSRHKNDSYISSHHQKHHLTHFKYGKLIVELEAGDSFGQVSFLNGSTRNSTIIAHDSNVEILCMPRKYFYLTIAKISDKIVFAPGAAMHLIRYTSPNGFRDENQISVMCKYMKNHLFFSQFPLTHLKKFAQVLTYVKLSPGHAICNEGDDADGFYVLLKGTVTIHVKNLNKAKTDKKECDSSENSTPIHSRPMSPKSPVSPTLHLKTKFHSAIGGNLDTHNIDSDSSGHSSCANIDMDDSNKYKGKIKNANEMIYKANEYTISKYGAQVSFLEQGDSFGESSLKNSNQKVGNNTGTINLPIPISKRTASVVCLTEVELVRINQNDFQNISRLHSDIMLQPKMCVNVLKKSENKRTSSDLERLEQISKHVSFLRQLPQQIVKKLCKVMKYKYLELDDVAALQGTRANKFFIILRGELALHKQYQVDKNISSVGKINIAMKTKSFINKLKKKRQKNSINNIYNFKNKNTKEKLTETKRTALGKYQHVESEINKQKIESQMIQQKQSLKSKKYSRRMSKLTRDITTTMKTDQNSEKYGPVTCTLATGDSYGDVAILSQSNQNYYQQTAVASVDGTELIIINTIDFHKILAKYTNTIEYRM